MTALKRIAIIGGGVIGLCAAWYALQDGHAVTLIERGSPDHDGCSQGNAGMIVPSHFVPLAAPGMIAYGLRLMPNPESPFGLRPRPDADLLRWGLLFHQASTAARVARAAPVLRDLHLASRRAYEELSDHFGHVFGLTKRGMLLLCKTDQALHEEAKIAERACALGLPAAVLSPSETAQTDPGVRMDIAGAVHYPQDGHLTPGAFLARLTTALQDGGAQLAWNTEVSGWRTDGGRIAAALTSQGDIIADEFVLAGGVWSPQTMRALGLRLPMQAGKGYSITLPHPRQQPELCSLLTEARVAVTPMGSALRFGGTMEIGGLDTTINQSRVNGILKAIPRYFPDFTPADFRDLPVWSGLRPCSPDGLPYIGRFRRFANLSAATGHAMMGLSLAPITGKLVADILSDRLPGLDLALLRPDRYG